MMKQLTNRGFTLIELLVVIAIIGILAAVVLTSLGSARSSANDSKIKSQLASVRAEAEIIATSANGSYATVCTSGNVPALRAVASGVTAACFDEPTTWVVHTPISTATFSWCADHTGASRRVSTAAIAATPTVCPAEA